MTIAAEQFLNSFDSLPEADKHAVAVEILRRVSSSAPDDLSDETFDVEGLGRNVVEPHRCRLAGARVGADRDLPPVRRPCA